MTRVAWSAKARGALLLAWWGLNLFTVGVVVVLLCAIFRHPSIIFLPARVVFQIGHWMVGIRVKMTGYEKLRKGQPYIFVSNHASWLDPPIMFLHLGANHALLVKKELYKIPILGQGLNLIGCAKIDRSNREAAIASTRRAAERVRQGRSFIVYPEGTRSPDGTMRPFKKGAFHLAIEVGVPVVPVTVNGTYRIMPKGTIGVTPGTVHLIVHDPIDVSQYTSEQAGELAERAWQAVHSGFSQSAAAASS